MKVRELIERLGKFDPDLVVVTSAGFEVEDVTEVDEERQSFLSRQKYRAHHVEIGPCSM